MFVRLLKIFIEEVGTSCNSKLPGEPVLDRAVLLPLRLFEGVVELLGEPKAALAGLGLLELRQVSRFVIATELFVNAQSLLGSLVLFFSPW